MGWETCEEWLIRHKGALNRGISGGQSAAHFSWQAEIRYGLRATTDATASIVREGQGGWDEFRPDWACALRCSRLCAIFHLESGALKDCPARRASYLPGQRPAGQPGPQARPFSLVPTRARATGTCDEVAKTYATCLISHSIGPYHQANGHRRGKQTKWL